MVGEARRLKKAHKKRFKQEKNNPSIKQLEQKRQELQQQTKDSRRIARERLVERVRVVQRQRQPQTTRERLKQALKEQIAQGGRQFHLEQKARSAEFKRQNQLPSGVLGSDIPGLVEEQERRQHEMADKLKGSDNDT